MRTQKLPGLSKASGTLTFSLIFLHCDLVYGVSEYWSPDRVMTELGELLLGLLYLRNSSRLYGDFDGVNYCLDYHTSETPILRTLKA